MKVLFKERLEFITPAFLAGAEQNLPEIRVPSIRGELRWWFRILGGAPENEAAVFGSVHGTVKASAVVLRTSGANIKPGPELTFSPMSDKGYIYYFARASGNNDGVHRTMAQHYFAPGTSFNLEVLSRTPLTAETEAKLQVALRAFSMFGALGLRATRGCGALASQHGATLEQLKSLCDDCGDSILVRKISDEVFQSGEKCQEALGGFLRDLRRSSGFSGKEKSALGFSNGRVRASSALRLRPLKIDGVHLPVVVYSDAACSQPSLRDLIEAQTAEISAMQ